jgi:hypothetical protein
MEIVIKMLDECCAKGNASETSLIEPGAYGKAVVGLQDMICNVSYSITMKKYIS